MDALALLEYQHRAFRKMLSRLEHDAQPGPLFDRLADALAIERYNLTRLIDRLEQEGLVTRARSPQDGRAAYATITREGRALRKKMWKVYQATVADLFLARFDAAEQARFAAALDAAAGAARQSAA